MADLPSLRVGDGDLDLYTGLDVDRGDLLDDLGRRVQIDDTLVQAHLETIPSLGTLTARRLTGRDTQDLGRHANWALNAQLLLLGAADQVSAHLLQAADIARGQRDADPVNGRGLGNGLLDVLSSGGHFARFSWIFTCPGRDNQTFLTSAEPVQTLLELISEDESTDAKNRGGLARSSEEVSVMEME